MSDQVIVVQMGDAEDTGVQVAYFNTVEEATRHIESCLEAGCGRDNISAYRATRLNMQVTHRPVVSLEEGAGSPLPPEGAGGYPLPPEGAPDVPEGTADSKPERLSLLPEHNYTPRTN